MLEIVLTLEATVDHMKLEEEEGQGEGSAPPSNTPAISSQPQIQQQQQVSQPLTSSRKHSDLPPLPSELTDSPISASPPSRTDTESGVGPIKRRHSRGRSVTSKAEMMSRPNSAKASYNPPQAKDHVPNRPTSPIAVSYITSSTAESFSNHSGLLITTDSGIGPFISLQTLTSILRYIGPS